MKFLTRLKTASLFLLLFSLYSCIGIKKYNYNVTQRKFSPQELRKDFSVMRSSLEEAHPGIYWYTNKQALDAKFDSVYNSLNDSLTMMDFYKRAAPVIAQIRCGHTRLIMRASRLSKRDLNEDKAKGKPIFNDIDFRIEGHKLYVVKNYGKNSLLKPGDELVAINNKPLSNLLDIAKTLISSDGYNTTYFDRALEKNAYGWYRLFNKPTDTLQLTIRDSLKERTVSYVRKLIIDSKANPDVHTFSVKENKIPRYRGTDDHGQPLLELTYTDKDSTTAVMKVKSFSFAGNNHSKFYRKSFADIKKHGVKNLVIDIRNNGGGTLLASRNLFAHLTNSPFVFLGKTYANKRFYKAPIGFVINLNYFLRSLLLFKKDPEHGYLVNLKGSKPLLPKADNYTGKLAVLINGYTFSASALLAANLKEINRAIFIGEETGGGFNECSAGQLPLLKLPETKLVLRLPLYRLAPNTSTPVKGHGIYPEYTVIPKVSELIKGKDPELDKALAVLREKD